MKKQLFIIGLCLVLGAVLVAGCLGGDDANNSSNNSSDNSSNNSTIDPSFVPPEPIEAPADTAMYRGNVTNIATANNTTTMTLAQVKGTNFGAATMKFVFDENSKMNFNISDLKNGQYVEVYYGAPASGTTNFSETQTVIVANVLRYAGQVVYNGEIVKVTPAVNASSTSYVGKIEVKLENKTTMIFNCDENTQFYLNMSKVKAGEQIDIYGSWIVQTSMPAQTSAYEIREYYSTGTTDNGSTVVASGNSSSSPDSPENNPAIHLPAE
ncbi:hypothetical protein [Methanimicrococcus blatticola]|uniref:DUF5666 domain-containing protein n=1 Tax=Methanimicrococcus blatticola TaxID=91560 RepID=A0A484F3S1_9EURY|nr:hypothetical protein [Methanimicrococcus blatticola]MBZ3935793.1 hypothetical protein [Methanimicrococcus blatticola]MCC2508087.1 hypothetical protein [Methanimicrococcus blatticola]TDQ68833.1 hypothetical protein C7391_1031 [Methanimicrococcus blatticola]